MVSIKDLTLKIKRKAIEIGFDDVRIANPNNERSKENLLRFLNSQGVSDMKYLKKHTLKRAVITEVHKETKAVICVRKDYLTTDIKDLKNNLKKDIYNNDGVISLYALGDDYHNIIHDMLTKLKEYIESLCNIYGHRAFVDTAPILERSLAEDAGIGFVGKSTNIINHKEGSFFFLGELAVNIPLIKDSKVKPRCGSCKKCIDICPTKAIIAPYILDVDLCISYLTIEHKGIIPDSIKPKIGEHIFGCDDCQVICPWNRYAKLASEKRFHVKQCLKEDIFKRLLWTEQQFLKNLEKSPILRTGYFGWVRNHAIVIANIINKNSNKKDNLKKEAKDLLKEKLEDLTNHGLVINKQNRRNKKNLEKQFLGAKDAILWAIRKCEDNK